MVEKLETLLLLLGAVGILAVVAGRLKFPLPILLVLAGLVIAFFPALPDVTLDPEMVLMVFLPPLLHAASARFPWEDFRSQIRPIMAMAVGLVFVTMTGVAFAAHWMIPGITLAAGFVLGAIVSPPDAVAATAVLRNVRMPKRMLVVLEGESLVNDSSGLVAFQFAVAAVVTGSFSLVSASWEFVWMSVGGVLFGILVGWVTSRLHSRLNDPPVQITLTILTPYVAYLTAERMGISGVLATVAAGLFIGNYSWRTQQPESRLQVRAIWEFIDFLLNGIIFILIGLQFPSIMEQLVRLPLWKLMVYGAYISGVVIFIRFAYVMGMAGLQGIISKRRKEKTDEYSLPNLIVVSWAGMRGVVSLAAALAIPEVTANGEPFSDQHMIIFLTFCVILVTLVLQGLTLPALVRWLGVEETVSEVAAEGRARMEILETIIEEIDSEMKHRKHGVDEQALTLLRETYVSRLHVVSSGSEGTETKSSDVRVERAFYSNVMDHARHRLTNMRRQGKISETVRRVIEHDLDTEQQRHESTLRLKQG